MKLSEAIRLGSTLLRPREGGGAKDTGYGCAMQAAYLAIGRPEYAYGSAKGKLCRYTDYFREFDGIYPDGMIYNSIPGKFDEAVFLGDPNPFETAALYAEQFETGSPAAQEEKKVEMDVEATV